MTLAQIQAIDGQRVFVSDQTDGAIADGTQRPGGDWAVVNPVGGLPCDTP